MVDVMEPVRAEVGFRLEAEGEERRCVWGEVGADVLGRAAPWRTFRWRDGQQHYSGLYWSATSEGHVIYESRLELARVLFADFDPAVTGIVAQPFMLRAEVGGVVRRHVPDYLLLGEGAPVVVDVKPRSRLGAPGVAETFGWTRRLVEAVGWGFEVWSEPEAAVLANIRFLAGYRRAWLFDAELLAALRGAGLAGLPLGEVLRVEVGWPWPLVRAAVLHLVWRGVFAVDLSVPLSAASVLEAGR